MTPLADTAPTLVQRLRARAADYAQLGKLRLALLVVISAGFGYVIGRPPLDVSLLGLAAVLAGGLLITLAANALNEVIERREDALMQRTADRPLPAGRLSVGHAAAFAVVVGAVGIGLIGACTNAVAAGWASAALLTYAFVYTPAKKLGVLAVPLGAFPGALPPLIGYVGATGHFDATGGLLFALQYLWQFPHFWAVAWRLDADYHRAGYRLLPAGRSRATATVILISLAGFVPVLAWASLVGLVSTAALVALCAVLAAFTWPAVALWRTRADADALRLMFASFLALPALQLILLLDHLL